MLTLEGRNAAAKFLQWLAKGAPGYVADSKAGRKASEVFVSTHNKLVCSVGIHWHACARDRDSGGSEHVLVTCTMYRMHSVLVWLGLQLQHCQW